MLTTAPTTCGFVVAGLGSPDTTFGFTSTVLPLIASFSKQPMRDTASLIISFTLSLLDTPTRALFSCIKIFSRSLGGSFFLGLKKICAMADLFQKRRKDIIRLIKYRRENILNIASPKTAK